MLSTTESAFTPVCPSSLFSLPDDGSAGGLDHLFGLAPSLLRLIRRFSAEKVVPGR